MLYTVINAQSLSSPPFPVVVRVLNNSGDRNAVIAHSISTSAEGVESISGGKRRPAKEGSSQCLWEILSSNVAVGCLLGRCNNMNGQQGCCI